MFSNYNMWSVVELTAHRARRRAMRRAGQNFFDFICRTNIVHNYLGFISIEKILSGIDIKGIYI